MLSDSHCHFDFTVFNDDRESLWRQCKQHGITQLLMPGIHEQQWHRVAQISDQLDGLYFSVGLHPWWLDKQTKHSKSVLDRLAQYLEHPRCVGIGECGLDALKSPPLTQQIHALRQQLEVACDTQQPVILHCVKAHNELLQLLNIFPNIQGVIHGFSGSTELAQTYWSKGLCMGIGGTITYERAQKTIRAIQSLPDDALLLETDAPDMPLAGKQGQRNSPLALLTIVKTLAELRGQSTDELTQATAKNFARVFTRTTL